MNGVANNTGIVIAMNSVCSCVIAMVSAIPLAVPTKRDKNEPTHVGHAMNKPVTAPMPLIPLPFLDRVYALTAIAVFNPTK